MTAYDALTPLTTAHVANEVIVAATDNAQASSINAIVAELGAAPRGAAASLAARLTTMSAGAVQIVAGAGGVLINDSAALQTAVDAYAYTAMIALVGNLSITAPVLLATGTYLDGARGKLVAHSSLTSTVLRNAGYGAIEAASTGNADITLVDVEIDGNKAGRGGATGHLIEFRGGAASLCGNLQLVRVTGYQSPNLGIVFQNCQDVLVDAAHVHDNTRDGITFMWNCRHVRVRTPHVYDCGDDLLAFNGEDASTTGHTMSDIFVESPDLHGQTTFGSGIAIRGVSRIKVVDPVIRDTFAAGIFIGNFNTSTCDDVTIANPTIINAGTSNSGGAGPGIEINAGATPFSAAGVADVTNIRILNMDVRNARSHGVFLSGISTAKVAGVKLTGRIACGSLYASGRGVTATAGYVEDLTADLDITGAQLGAARVAGTNVKRIRWTGRAYDNANSTSTGALGFDAVEDLYVTGVRAYDTRVTKLQTYGVDISNTTGDLVVTTNDCSGNLTGPIRITQGASATNQVISNNVGYDPRSGTLTTTSLLQNYAVGGTTTYYRDGGITFLVPFPTGMTPKIFATSRDVVGAAVSVYTATNTSATARVHAMRTDLPATVVDWVALNA